MKTPDELGRLRARTLKARRRVQEADVPRCKTMEIGIQMHYRVEVAGVVSAGTHGAIPRVDLEQHLDGVMDALLDTDQACDPAVDVEFSTCVVSIGVSVSASNPLAATEVGSGIIRTAIHTVGGRTPDWPTPDSDEWCVTLTNVSADQLVDA